MFEVFDKCAGRPDASVSMPKLVTRSVRPELVEGQSRTVPNEATLFAVSGEPCKAIIASVRFDKALHFDRLSANGCSTDGGVKKVATNKAAKGAA